MLLGVRHLLSNGQLVFFFPAVVDKLLLSDRVDQLQKHDAYITVKDQKESFPHNASFRLINPSKSDIG